MEYLHLKLPCEDFGLFAASLQPVSCFEVLGSLRLGGRREFTQGSASSSDRLCSFKLELGILSSSATQGCTLHSMMLGCAHHCALTHQRLITSWRHQAAYALY